MDIAYDHIQETTYSKDPSADKADGDSAAQKERQQETQASLNEDIQEAYKAISSSVWGANIGGFFGSVIKQGESVYQTAQKELTAASGEATRSLDTLKTTLIAQTRNLSLNQDSTSAEGSSRSAPSDGTATADGDLLGRLRTTAAQRLKDIQRAEDAADAALLQFGSSVRDFLKDAITVAPSGSTSAGQASGSKSEGFESKDASGKRVIHSTRFEAQLHVLHSNPEMLLRVPEEKAAFEKWKGTFDISGKTEEITDDLEEYPELRSTMEKLVPEEVTYAEFWCRYYFMRHGIETAESRRKELLKAAAAGDDVSGWGDDSDSESEVEPAAPITTTKKPLSDSEDDEDSDEDSDAEAPASKAPVARPVSAGSSRTIQQKKPDASRTSNETDSDTSYDVVGAASGAPSKTQSKGSKEDSDSDSEEEDWE